MPVTNFQRLSFPVGLVEVTLSFHNYGDIIMIHVRFSQKQLPAHSIITKDDLIFHGSCFCENYSYL